jgi:hypothetical protein
MWERFCEARFLCPAAPDRLILPSAARGEARRCRFGRLSGSFSGALSRDCRSHSEWRLRLVPLPTPASLAPDASPPHGLVSCPPLSRFTEALLHSYQRRSGSAIRDWRRPLGDQGAGPSSVSVVEVREHDEPVRRRGGFFYGRRRAESVNTRPACAKPELRFGEGRAAGITGGGAGR